MINILQHQKNFKVKNRLGDVVLDFESRVGKNDAIMPGCGQKAVILLAVLATAAAAGAEPEGSPTRVSVLIAAQDVFSRRTSGYMEHLGAQRFDREPGWQVVGAERLFLQKDSIPSLEFFEAAVRDVGLGLGQYENLELDRAVSTLSRAVDGFEKVPQVLFGSRVKSYIKALTFLGASLILHGDIQAGQEAFRRLLVHDRRAQLDRSLFPPAMVGTFEAVRRDVVEGPRGSLSVFTTPSHGKVYVDGVFRGVSPCTVERLPAGRHLVVVRKVGYLIWGGTAQVESGEEQKTRVRLVELPDTAQLLEDLNVVAAELDEDDELPAGLRERAAEGGLDRFVLGRLQQRGQGVYYLVCLYELPSGKVIRSHEGVVNQEERGFANAVDAIFSFLLTGREEVLESAGTIAVGGTLRLKDEELFQEDETPIYHRWYFWTACGVGAASVAVLLVLLLSGNEEQPKSQILLEF